MATAVEVADPGEWVRTCREHNQVCTVVDGERHWERDQVLCPADGGHVLLLDMQWKVTRRERPAARGWDGSGEVEP